MISELEKALNTCNVDELVAILAHDPSLINALNDKGCLLYTSPSPRDCS